VRERNHEYYKEMKANMEEMAKLESVFIDNEKKVKNKIQEMTDKNVLGLF
jgi:hypothetical protein